MSRDQSPSPMGIWDKFMAACISVFIGAIALNWAAQLLDEIWLELLIGLGVILLVVIGVAIHRWRINRW